MRPLLASLLVLASFASLTGIKAGDSPQIEKIQMGQYWYGAEISKKDLLGKVVVLEVWGKN